MIKATYLSLITLYLLLITGCGALPKPFHRTVSPPNALTQPKGDNGVRVSFPLGTTKPMSKQIANAVVHALLQENIPASCGEAGKLRYLLSGRIEPIGSTAVSLPSRINWQLSSNDGAWYYNFYQEFDGFVWEGGIGSQKAVDDLGKATANIIANTITPEDKSLAAVIPKMRGLWLLPIKGKSNARVHALNRAMKHALAVAKVRLSNTSSTARYFMRGKITLSSVKNKPPLAKISWSITDRDGSPIGQLVQQNAIPTKTFHESWNETSLLIATAAVPSIKNLLSRANEPLNTNVPGPNLILETNILDSSTLPLIPPSKLPPKRN